MLRRPARSGHTRRWCRVYLSRLVDIDVVLSVLHEVLLQLFAGNLGVRLKHLN